MSESKRRVCVVTGGAAGIGLAVVERLAGDGDTVVALDRDDVALAELASRAAASNWDVETIRLDVSDPAAMDRVAGDISGRHATVDVLACAAGVQRYGTVEETSPELFQEVIGVNLGGVFFACHSFMPMLKREGAGAVVIVSSVQAFGAQTGVAAYCASKGALIALVKSMAVDHAREGVRVNAVCPGSVDTPMLRWAADQFGGGRPTDDVVAEWGRSHPMGRVAQPSEVADAVTYLAGPEAGFITGAAVNVDGGLLAGLAVVLPDT